MKNTGQRQARRWKLAIPAAVCDRGRQNSIRCMIHDGSITGCKIVSGQVSKLPDEILINVPELDKLIHGRIVWRTHNSAGIQFEWETDRPDERRKASRQKIHLPATILDYGYNKLADCIICDASRTGCRISSKAISGMPDDLLIEIPGLTEPILSLIVWRNDDMAGLEFMWNNKLYMLDDYVEM